MAQNLPEEFLQRMEEMLGSAYPAFCSSYEKPWAHGLRLNRLKGIEAVRKACGIFQLSPVPWALDGFYYGEEERPGKHPFHEAGLYYIQEPSAMAAAQLLSPEPGDYVLDLCAAPGGKSTHIASLLNGQGFLLSNEIHSARAKILSGNVERMGIANAAVTNHDSQSLSLWFPEFFDKILVDAPCSGEGMFRKDENARAEWSPSAVEICAGRQQEILHHAAKMLKPGGLLLYSTCTFAPAEDEGSVESFLDGHPEFSISSACFYEGFARGNPRWVPGGKGRSELEQTIRIWPHQAFGEGHYLALLKKAGATEKEARLAGKGDGIWSRIRDAASRDCFQKFCQETLALSSGENPFALPWEEMPGQYRMFGENLYYAHKALPEGKGMRILRPGLHLGTFKTNRFEPSHALALYLKPDQVKRVHSLSVQDDAVLRYLKGETLECRENAKGWTLVDVDGFSLGWAKQAGTVLKNHYPKGLRWH